MPLFSRSGLTGVVNRLVSGHLVWIDRTTRRAPRLVTVLTLMLVLLSTISILRIRFETDIFRLFPADRPALRLLLDSLAWSGGAREAYFLLEGEPAALQAEATAFAERLRRLKVDGAPAFKRVIYRVYEESEAQPFADLIAFAASHPAAFVPVADRQRLADRFSAVSMQAAMGQLTAQLAGSLGAADARLAVADPLAVRDLFLPRLKAASQALDMDNNSPYFLSRDGRVLIMIAEPAKPVQEMAFARKLVAAVNQARSGSKVRISCAGAHISAVIDEAAMQSNILSCILSSLVVVLGIFYATYRRLWPTLMIPLILGVGVLLALGSAGLFLTDIHIISFAFMALIIGLGTDYSIHLYDRFHTERAGGLTTDEAVRLAVTDTGHGLFTAAATTALPFLALGWAEVRALSELGILVGLGVLFSLYATLFLMPPLLRLTDNATRCYPPLPAFGMGRIWRLAGSHPGLVIAATVLLLLLFGLQSGRIDFDGELKNLQPRHSEAFKAQELVERHLSLAPKHLLVALDGGSAAEVLQRAETVERLAARFEGAGQVAAWSSLGRTLNRSNEQQEIISALQKVVDPARMLEQALLRNGFETAPFAGYLQQLSGNGLTRSVEPLNAVQRLAASPLRGVVERHLQQDRNGWHALTYLYYHPGKLDQAGFIKQLQQAAPAARVTGVELVGRELLEAVRRSFINGFIWGGLLVLALLLAHFRSITGIIASLGPVLFGGVAMLGMMVLTGMKLNFMNAMVLVTIIGMGSDYGMHIQHRCAEADPAEQEARFIQAGRGVLLSALTTIAGFGSLAFTDYGAMSSIGWATNFGIGFTLVASLLLLPAVVRIAHR